MFDTVRLFLLFQREDRHIRMLTLRSPAETERNWDNYTRMFP